MATDVDDIVKQGYIRIRSRRLGIWQRRWVILRRASSKGPCRLEKYPDEKCARSGGNHKMALLTTVNTISRMPTSMRRHAFTICFHDGTSKCLSCDSDMDADTWVKLFVQECLLPQPGLATGEPDVLSPGIQKELQEQFHVYLMPTPKLDVFGECLLQVTHENIYLWDVANPRLKLVAWPLTALRRYGSDPTKFTFEAGRHCCTGEGMFVFHTLEGEKIYRKVHQATLAIAEAHHRLQDQLGKNSRIQESSANSNSSQMQAGLSLSQEITLQSGGHRSETIVTQELINPSSSGDVAGPSGIREKSETDSEEQSFRRLPHVGVSKCSLRSHLLQCNLTNS